MENSNDIWAVTIGSLMIVHLALGMPLFVVLGLGSLVLISVAGVYSFEVFGQVPFSALDNWAFLAMPLFVLSGDIISTGRIARALVRFAHTLLGWLPGGLGMATIGGCFFISGTSGSNSADTAAIGRIMIPPMAERGYPRDYAAALAAAGGCLGIIVPPSIVFIIYGSLTSTSVGDLFIGGLLPGVLMAASLCVANYFVCRTKGWGGASEGRFSGRDVMTAAWEARYGLLAPVIILAGIYSGVFTPTESAAVAVAYFLFLELCVTRAVKVKEVPALFLRSGAITGLLGPIIAFSLLFGEVLSILRIPDRLASALLTIPTGPISTILMMTFILLVIGCFLETFASLVILMPILLPVAMSINLDPVHLGIFVVCALTVGFITPPVGLNLFAASAVSGVPYLQIARRAWPLFLALLASVLVVAFVPWLSIWFKT